MAKISYPYRLTDCGKEVVIYKNGDGAYTIAYREDGRRMRFRRSNEDEAHRDAKRVLVRLLNRPVPFTQSEDAPVYRAAQNALVGFNVGVDEACRDYARARQAIGGVPLAEAVAAYLRHKPVKDDKDLAQLTVDYLAEISVSASKDGFKAVRRRLRRFGRRFGSRKISSIEQDEIINWLTGLAVGPRTRNNERQTLVTFFNWCQTKRYLPRNIESEAAQIPLLKTKTRVEIYCLTDVAKLFKALLIADSPLLPYAIVGFFAGIRPVEITRLRYEEALRWKHGDIEVRENQSKTGARRLVPMARNFREWMRPFADRTGLIAVAHADEKLAAFAKSLGLRWPRDVMRHSYISYNVAAEEQIGSVAMWAGNSEQIIKKNYLKMVTKPEGVAYGKILPNWPAKVVRFNHDAIAA